MKCFLNDGNTLIDGTIVIFFFLFPDYKFLTVNNEVKCENIRELKIKTVSKKPGLLCKPARVAASWEIK